MIKIFNILIKKITYWSRIFSTYVFRGKNNLSFWHGEPAINNDANFSELDQYFMEFKYKADYQGPFDSIGIPQLNYEGDIGIQYNPIAIAQWSLGNYNSWKKNNKKTNYDKFFDGADWLVDNLKLNPKNQYVWNHYFNWVYKEELINPWYSGLAQGQGLSVLCRAYHISKNKKYLDCLNKVYTSFLIDVKDGGVTFTDNNEDIWIEEYIMQNKPTHILNGFIWGLWGIYDYWLLTKDTDAKNLFDKYAETLRKNIKKYDIGYWSLYELSDNAISMRASTFYHKLHIVQLHILFKMTNIDIFQKMGDKWLSYLTNSFNKYRAIFMKIIFKIFYY